MVLALDHADHYFDTRINVQKAETVKTNIAFFDFDGTITTKDTMLELIRFHHGNAAYYKGLFVISPYLLMMKAGLLSNHQAKEKMLTHFFKGFAVAGFDQLCQDFSRTVVPALIRPGAIQKIAELRRDDTEIVVVTASAENWVKPWCETMGIAVLATALESIDGKLTGRLTGENCHGDEKVSRIRQTYDLSGYGSVSCFGDSSGDKPMLALATHAYYKPFR